MTDIEKLAIDSGAYIIGGCISFSRREISRFAVSLNCDTYKTEVLKEIDSRLLRCSALGLSAADAYDSFYQDLVQGAMTAAPPAPKVPT